MERLLQIFTTKNSTCTEYWLFIADKPSQCCWTETFCVADGCEWRMRRHGNSCTGHIAVSTYSNVHIDAVGWRPHHTCTFDEPRPLSTKFRYRRCNCRRNDEGIKEVSKVKKRPEDWVLERCHQCGNTGDLKTYCLKKGKKGQHKDFDVNGQRCESISTSGWDVKNGLSLYVAAADCQKEWSPQLLTENPYGSSDKNAWLSGLGTWYCKDNATSWWSMHIQLGLSTIPFGKLKWRDALLNTVKGGAWWFLILVMQPS